MQFVGAPLALDETERDEVAETLRDELTARGFDVDRGVTLTALNGLVPVTPMQGTVHEIAFVAFGEVRVAGAHQALVGLVVGDAAELPGGVELRPAMCG